MCGTGFGTKSGANQRVGTEARHQDLLVANLLGAIQVASRVFRTFSATRAIASSQEMVAAQRSIAGRREPAPGGVRRERWRVNKKRGRGCIALDGLPLTTDDNSGGR